MSENLEDKNRYLRWWEYYAKPPKWWDWEADDLGLMIELIARKPPNKSLEHFSTLAFIAGMFQASGELAYLELKINKRGKLYTPMFKISADLETIEKLTRLFGDVHSYEYENNRKNVKITVTGLRAIIILRMISQFLIGSKRKMVDMVVQNGYKITNSERIARILEKVEITVRPRKMYINGRTLRKITLI